MVGAVSEWMSRGTAGAFLTDAVSASILTIRDV